RRLAVSQQREDKGDKGKCYFVHIFSIFVKDTNNICSKTDKKQKNPVVADQVLMLLTNQKTINYEKFITLKQDDSYLVFASANVETIFSFRKPFLKFNI